MGLRPTHGDEKLPVEPYNPEPARDRLLLLPRTPLSEPRRSGALQRQFQVVFHRVIVPIYVGVFMKQTT